MAHLETTPSNRMLLESAQIGVSHSSHAPTWPWALHGAAHQGLGVSSCHPTESAESVFEILDDPDHATSESGA